MKVTVHTQPVEVTGYTLELTPEEARLLRYADSFFGSPPAGTAGSSNRRVYEATAQCLQILNRVLVNVGVRP